MVIKPQKKIQNATKKKSVRSVPRKTRWVCAFCSQIFDTFWEIDQHFTSYHKLDNLYGIDHNL